jgi:hypothetical protein
VYTLPFLFRGDPRAPRNLSILRKHYGFGFDDELFERDMNKLRSVLKCKNAGAVEQKKGATNMESKQGGIGQQLQDGRDMADGWQTVQRRRKKLPAAKYSLFS